MFSFAFQRLSDSFVHLPSRKQIGRPDCRPGLFIGSTWRRTLNKHKWQDARDNNYGLLPFDLSSVASY